MRSNIRINMTSSSLHRGSYHVKFFVFKRSSSGWICLYFYTLKVNDVGTLCVMYTGLHVWWWCEGGCAQLDGLCNSLFECIVHMCKVMIVHLIPNNKQQSLAVAFLPCNVYVDVFTWKQEWERVCTRGRMQHLYHQLVAVYYSFNIQTRYWLMFTVTAS